jgi:hypothetical protein
MSALCQKQTFALQQKAMLFDHLVGAAESMIGTVRPSALAVFILMMSSTFVDWCTGRSAGFSPLRKPHRDDACDGNHKMADLGADGEWAHSGG